MNPYHAKPASTTTNALLQWHSLDQEVRQHQERLKELRARRDALEQRVLQEAASTQETEWSLPSGKWRIAQTKVTEPLTFRFLEQSLSKIVRNPDQVRLLLEHVKRDRSQSYVRELKPAK